MAHFYLKQYVEAKQALQTAKDIDGKIEACTSKANVGPLFLLLHAFYFSSSMITYKLS